MNICIEPKKLKGRIGVPESKSYLHREIIAASLADRDTLISCHAVSRDINATIECVNSLGGKAVAENGAVKVSPITRVPEDVCLNFYGSATTARMIIPVASALCDGFSCVGDYSLCRRPMGALRSSLGERGVSLSADYLPLTVRGRFSGGECTVDGSLSSQFTSGMLFALSRIVCRSTLRVTGENVSLPYTWMTLAVLNLFGQSIEYENGIYLINGMNTLVSPGTVTPPADSSLAAYYLFASMFGSDVTVDNTLDTSLQGDSAYYALAQAIKDEQINEIDVTDIPDLFPILALTVCGGKSTVGFTGTSRLRFKESDRVNAVIRLIDDLGGRVSAGENSVTVYGTEGLRGGTVQASGDHRIALAGAFASVICQKSVCVNEIECVDKSYPSFLHDFSKLGGEYSEI